MKYYYFASYTFENDFGQKGNGNIFFSGNKKIRTLEDTEPVIEEIEKSGVRKIVLQHIDLLDEE